MSTETKKTLTCDHCGKSHTIGDNLFDGLPAPLASASFPNLPPPALTPEQEMDCSVGGINRRVAHEIRKNMTRGYYDFCDINCLIAFAKERQNSDSLNRLREKQTPECVIQRADALKRSLRVAAWLEDHRALYAIAVLHPNGETNMLLSSKVSTPVEIRNELGKNVGAIISTLKTISVAEAADHPPATP